MKTIHAVWKDGRIVPAEPIDWPDGTALTVEPVEEPSEADSGSSLMGGDPASIARWTAAFDALPPLRMSEQEEAEWQAARRAVRDHTVARMRERPDGGRP